MNTPWHAQRAAATRLSMWARRRINSRHVFAIKRRIRRRQRRRYSALRKLHRLHHTGAVTKSAAGAPAADGLLDEEAIRGATKAKRRHRNRANIFRNLLGVRTELHNDLSHHHSHADLLTS